MILPFWGLLHNTVCFLTLGQELFNLVRWAHHDALLFYWLVFFRRSFGSGASKCSGDRTGKGSPFKISSFNKPLADFLQSLEDFLFYALDTALQDSGEYQDGLDKLYETLSNCIADPSEWHKIMVPVSYEYVRGAAPQYPDMKKRIDDLHWEAVTRYIKTPERIKSKGAALDFSNIFCDPLPTPDHKFAFNTEMLNQAFISGSARANGEDLADIVNDLLRPRGPGIVETDEELARMLAVIGAECLDAPLKNSQLICDPCSGSGRLLTAAHHSVFQNTEPSQWWANEIEPCFTEALSLRLGLDHANALQLSATPKITIGDMADLNVSDFQHVRMILMNPPFLSGVQADEKKQHVAKAIQRISGKASTVNKSQIGLEALFLELVLHLAPKGCVFAVIMPHLILRRKSDAMVAFREFLLAEFGLTHLVTYPREGLFEQVSKRTAILVGRKGASNNTIKHIDVRVPLERLDLRRLAQLLRSDQALPSGEIIISAHKKSALLKDAGDGWSGGSAATIGKQWVNAHFKDFSLLSQIAPNMKRGTSGNSGAADLSAIPSKPEFAAIIKKIPEKWRASAINNSDATPKQLDARNRDRISPLFPDAAFEDRSSHSAIILDEILELYLKIKKANLKKPGAQKKVPLTLMKVRDSLRKDAKLFPQNSVLIPRASRAYCKIGVLNEQYVVSTNFFIVPFSNHDEAMLAASWLASVFSQIHMEVLNNDQEGMRKLEATEIRKLSVPNFNTISVFNQRLLIKAFLESPPLDLKYPKPRKLDELWATQLCPKNADDFLQEAMDVMSDLCEERSP